MILENTEAQAFPWIPVDPALAALLNRLHSASGRLALEAGGTRWKVDFLPRSPRGYRAAYAVEAAVRNGKVTVDMDRLPLPRLLGYPLEGVPPLEVPEDLLPALLEGVLSGFLAAAETVLGAPVRLQRVWALDSDADLVPPEGHCLHLGLAEEAGSGRIRARLFLRDEELQALAEAAEGSPAPAAASGGESEEPWANLPVRLVVRAGGASFPASELAALAPGDVVLLDRNIAEKGALRIGAGEAGREKFNWTATRMEGGVLIEKEIAMENLDNGAAPQGAALDLETMEVPLAFDLGARPATLAELRSLAAGTILELPGNAEGRVTLRAGGRTIGTGTLVMLGDRAGVRIDALWKGEAA